MPPTWGIPPLPGFPGDWRWDERGDASPSDTSLTWVGARGALVRVAGASPGSSRLFVDGEAVAEGSDVLRLPDTLFDCVGWHTLRVESVDLATGARLSHTHQLGVVLDIPTGAWRLPVDDPPLRPWVRAARLAATLARGAQDHLSLVTALTHALHRGIPTQGRKRIRPVYAVDPRYLPDRNPPWDLQGFLDWLDNDADGELPLACDGAVALVALLSTVLGAEAAATRLEMEDPETQMVFHPFHLFGTREMLSVPTTIHQLVVVDRGATNPIVLDPTLDWGERGLDTPLPLRLYLSRHLQAPVGLKVSPPRWALADAGALDSVGGERERPTPGVTLTQGRLSLWADEEPEARVVWDTTRGSGATFRIYDRRERTWGVVEVPQELGVGVEAMPRPPVTVRGTLPTSLPADLLAAWR